MCFDANLIRKHIHRNNIVLSAEICFEIRIIECKDYYLMLIQKNELKKIDIGDY